MNLTYDGYRMVFFIGLGLTILFLLVTVALFFVFKVPEIIGDLTGRTANKAIKEIRGNSVKTGVSSGVSSNKKSKKKKRKTIPAKPQVSAGAAAQETSVLGDVSGNETAVLTSNAPLSQETAVLGDVNAAAQQVGQETAVLGNIPPAPVKKQSTPLKTASDSVPASVPAKNQVEKGKTKTDRKEKKSGKGGAEKMYMPMQGNNIAGNAETSELIDLTAPNSVELYGSNDSLGNMPQYNSFIIEYDMTLAESRDIIP